MMAMDSSFGVVLLTLAALLTGLRSFPSVAGSGGSSTSELLTVTTTTPIPGPPPYNCPDTTFGLSCWAMRGILECSDQKFTCIQKRDSPLSKYGKVTTMNFKSNQITHLPSYVFIRQYRDRAGLAEVTTLDLSFNQLNRIDGYAFAGLTALEVLSLSSNNLQNIPSEAFNDLEKLKHLNLRINPIATIPPHAFSSLAALAKLELSFCHIATISPDAFQDLHSLAHLDLAQNRLDSDSIARDSFVGMPVLATVNLANNMKTFRLKDINWMEAFGISVPHPTQLRRSDENMEVDYGDLLEFKTPSPDTDTQPDYYEVPCKCKRLASDPPGTTTCPLIWKFFKANMSLECMGKAREPDYALQGGSMVLMSGTETEPMAKSDQDDQDKMEKVTDVLISKSKHDKMAKLMAELMAKSDQTKVERQASEQISKSDLDKMTKLMTELISKSDQTKLERKTTEQISKSDLDKVTKLVTELNAKSDQAKVEKRTAEQTIKSDLDKVTKLMTELIAKSDQAQASKKSDKVETPTAVVATKWSKAETDRYQGIWAVLVIFANLLMFILPAIFLPGLIN